VPICRVLTEHGCKIAPQTYYSAIKRGPSARDLRDVHALQEIRRVHQASRGGLYGARKVYHQLHRESVQVDGSGVARCTVERLMTKHGLVGVRRDRKVRTTIADRTAHRPADLVKRNFTADRPNQLWVLDFTYVQTLAGWVYVAFAIDVFSRMIVGWRASTRMRTDLPLDALEMAIWNRERAGHSTKGTVHHSDAGSQGGFNWSSQHSREWRSCNGSSFGSDDVDDRAAGDAVARATAGPPGCRTGILAQHRERDDQRRRRDGVRRVGARRDALVPRQWRHAAD